MVISANLYDFSAIARHWDVLVSENIYANFADIYLQYFGVTVIQGYFAEIPLDDIRNQIVIIYPFWNEKLNVKA